jgi:DNA-binding XRE family transcriptional regulator
MNSLQKAEAEVARLRAELAHTQEALANAIKVAVAAEQRAKAFPR